MEDRFFTQVQMGTIGEAGAIAEEVLSDHLALTSGDWRRWPYEVRSLRHATGHEHPGRAFAHLVRYGRPLSEKARGGDCPHFYRICLNDPVILQKTRGGDKEWLLPFMVYVMLHELIHIVRFGRYLYSPLREQGRGGEEARVDGMTRFLLSRVHLPGMAEVIGYFSGARDLPWGPARRPRRHHPYSRRCSHAHL